MCRADYDPVVQVRWDEVSSPFPEKRGSDGDGRESSQYQNKISSRGPFRRSKADRIVHISRLVLVTVVDHAL